MTIDQIAITIILIITFSLFVWGKWRYDIVAIFALCVLFILDVLLGGENSNLIKNPANVFLGFGHPAVITVAAVLILSRALRNSGVIDMLSYLIMPFSKKRNIHIFSLSSLVSIFSAFMNNVGALALMLPVAIKTSLKHGRSPSIILMPLAFASILGGMITMIGTPPNIIISTLRETQYLELKNQALLDNGSNAAKYFSTNGINIHNFHPEPFGMLDFGYVGGIIALLGLLFVTLFGWRLIPKKQQSKSKDESLFSINDYMTEIRIPENSSFIGKKINEIEKITDERLVIVNRIAIDEKIQPVKEDQLIQINDRFQIKADPVDLKLLMDQHGIRLIKKMRDRIDKLKNESTVFREVLVMPNSPLVNRDRTYFRKRTSNSLTVMALARQDQPLKKRLSDVIFQVGDVLLLQGGLDNMNENISILNLAPLEHREVQVGVFSKVSFALSVFMGSIIISMLGILPTTVSFLGAILFFLFSEILSVRELYDQIDWPIIVLLGAMMPISDALQHTGITEMISMAMVDITQNLPIWLTVAIIMVITMSLSDIINNAATALIMAPIAVGIAVAMGVNPDAFLMAVAIGASCAFLTPIGHQCNALILGPGGYKFSDYWKMGLPLEILIVIMGTPLILYFWPL